ncbi:MAG: hypothetical protein RLZZ292_2805, partial [Bacteroidota bacterium]
IKARKAKVRVVALEDDAPDDKFIARDEEHPEQVIYVKYNIAERNENFMPTIRAIRKVFGFPITLNLLDVEIDKDGTYRPKAIVIEPDYLVDVTAIAECFKDTGAEPLSYLLSRFLPKDSTPTLMVGNIANFFLDELISNPTLNFEETFPKVFRLNPLTFAVFDDNQIREIYTNSRKHFNNLKRIILDEFPKRNIDPNDCFLEPSFYSETYGIQGRLDLLHKHADDNSETVIVELKSGKPFKPNLHGISHNHYTQTLLYELMTKSAYGDSVKPMNYILYSGVDENNLKFAPSVRAQQYEAIQIRNQLLALEQAVIKAPLRTSPDPSKGGELAPPLPSPKGRELLDGKLDVNTTRSSTSSLPFGEGRGGVSIFTQLRQEKFEKSGFLKRDATLFEKTYNGLDDLEKSYFEHFAGFVAREHQLAKTGMQGVENANGVASLWLDSLEEKEENFEIISYLTIHQNNSASNDPFIRFLKSEKTNVLANFRQGDIAVLYPYDGSDQAVLRQQMFKCTIIELDKDSVTVRLRAKQLNQNIFKQYEHWHIEHDMLDSSFVGMYRSLFTWAMADKGKRSLLLTKVPPAPPRPSPKGREDEEAHVSSQSSPSPSKGGESEEAYVSSQSKNASTFSPHLEGLGEVASTSSLPLGEGRGGASGEVLTAEQSRIFQKVIVAEDYFLLWGPPGTGKTSMMLKYLVAYWLKNTNENLLLLAYTNRAVDEICEAIDAIGGDIREQYIRIGSKYSTAPHFHKQLLDSKMANVNKRNELREIIGKHRIFVATASSMSGKPELLQLKTFDRVVIDEASQILEPMLAGFLTHFKKFILIGDHRQLPAVVSQPVEESEVANEEMKAIGLNNLRNSLFERLYKRCIENNWHWAYDCLTHQGRMHQDIVDFPSLNFYDKSLKIMPFEGSFQSKPLTYQLPEFATILEQMLCSRRVLFIPTEADTSSQNNKTNVFEAELVADLVASFERIYTANNLTFQRNTLGIITPYRAQIAQIQQTLQEKNQNLDLLTVDTVERYQGGARDIILISLCTNRVAQLQSLVSASEEGIDRKLNVALTRARQHLIIVGNPKILEQNETYKKLMVWAKGEA